MQPTEAENRGSLCKPGRVINERKMEAKTILKLWLGGEKVCPGEDSEGETNSRQQQLQTGTGRANERKGSQDDINCEAELVGG